MTGLRDTDQAPVTTPVVLRDKPAWEDSEGREWTRWAGCIVVECPDCAFSFDEGHENTDGGYTCPNCDGGP